MEEALYKYLKERLRREKDKHAFIVRNEEGQIKCITDCYGEFEELRKLFKDKLEAYPLIQRGETAKIIKQATEEGD